MLTIGYKNFSDKLRQSGQFSATFDQSDISGAKPHNLDLPGAASDCYRESLSHRPIEDFPSCLLRLLLALCSICLFRRALLSFAQSSPDGRRTITPCCFDDDPSQVRIARFRDAAAAGSLDTQYQIRLPGLSLNWRRRHRKMKAIEMSNKPRQISRANRGAHSQAVGWISRQESSRRLVIWFAQEAIIESAWPDPTHFMKLALGARALRRTQRSNNRIRMLRMCRRLSYPRID